MKPIVDSLKVLGESTKTFESLGDNLFAPKKTEFNAPDYWTRLEHQAAIAAMGGICGNTNYDESTWESMAEDAIIAARTLIQKLKEKEE